MMEHNLENLEKRMSEIQDAVNEYESIKDEYKYLKEEIKIAHLPRLTFGELCKFIDVYDIYTIKGKDGARFYHKEYDCDDECDENCEHCKFMKQHYNFQVISIVPNGDSFDIVLNCVQDNSNGNAIEGIKWEEKKNEN